MIGYLNYFSCESLKPNNLNKSNITSRQKHFIYSPSKNKIKAKIDKLKVKSKFYIFSLFAFHFSLFTLQSAHATITSPTLITAINNVCPACITIANSSSATLTTTGLATTFIDLSYQSITDLTGIVDFTNLQTLRVSGNPLSGLPTFPNTLIFLDCSNIASITISNLPSGLQTLTCINDGLTSLPALPSGLTTLSCNNNQIAAITSLPSDLQQLDCSNNSSADGSIRYLKSLPSTLPSNLKVLNCSRNDISPLPALPSGLTYLDCYSNHGISSLPTLPSTLSVLKCLECSLTSLPTLSSSLTVLECQSNSITTSGFLGSNSSLPSGLTTLQCQGNVYLSMLPTLNAGLTLQIDEDHVLCLPNIPSGLTVKNKFGSTISPPPVCGTLPLEWLDFQIETLQTTSLLHWVTASESNVKYFLVERSDDGIVFQTISQPISAFNLLARHSYNYTDGKLQSGVTYYRIKETDNDGQVSYSLVRSINNMLTQSGFKIYPNPANQHVRLDLSDFQDRNITLSFSNAEGKILFFETLNTTSSSPYIFDVSNYASGLYFIKLEDIGKQAIIKKLQIVK